MIFVTLGTHPRPMDRLLQRLDEMVGEGKITDDVLVQSPAFGWRPQHLRTTGVLSHDEFVAQVRAADTVISHAGPGTLAEIRLAGKVPIVVPRLAAEGEQVDDHQLRYARHLAGVGGYVVVTDLADLPAAIDRASEVEATVRPDVSAAVEALEAVLRR